MNKFSSMLFVMSFFCLNAYSGDAQGEISLSDVASLNSAFFSGLYGIQFSVNCNKSSTDGQNSSYEITVEYDPLKSRRHYSIKTLGSDTSYALRDYWIENGKQTEWLRTVSSRPGQGLILDEPQDPGSVIIDSASASRVVPVDFIDLILGGNAEHLDILKRLPQLIKEKNVNYQISLNDSKLGKIVKIDFGDINLHIEVDVKTGLISSASFYDVVAKYKAVDYKVLGFDNLNGLRLPSELVETSYSPKGDWSETIRCKIDFKSIKRLPNPDLSFNTKFQVGTSILDKVKGESTFYKEPVSPSGSIDEKLDDIISSAEAQKKAKEGK